jgi:hypothetical protein
MKHYRKKPIVVEVIQWTGENYNEIRKFAKDTCIHRCNNKRELVRITTLEGLMEVKIGDYIIKGVNGEFYPCKENIFLKTYEEVKLNKEKE